MRKATALSILMVCLLAATAVILAQTTAATSAIDFSLIFRPPSDPRGVKVVTGHFRWRNTRGRTETTNMDMLGGVSLDSSAIASRGKPVSAVLADSATLEARYGRTQKTWVITVTDTTRADSSSHHGFVDITILDANSGAGRDTSLFISASGLWCPSLVIDSISVIFAPYDSIRAGDRTVLSWITTQWQ
jgi:hypothetical protein